MFYTTNAVFYFVWFLLGSMCLMALAQECTPGCSDTGTCVFASDASPVCSCFSGYNDETCDTRIAASCDASFGNVSNLQTDYVPAIQPLGTGLSFGVFSLTVNGPLVYGRENTAVRIANNTANPVCSYPGPNWQKLLDTSACEDSFVAAINWTDAVNCGWTVNNSVGGVSSYRASVVVDHKDYVDTFRDTKIYRQTEHVIPIQINFDTQITVSTEITVFAPVDFLAAITRQVYDPVSQVGTIEITTSLQWPFELSSIALPSFPDDGGLTASVQETTAAGSCPDTEGTNCLQTFEITIVPNGACTLSGLYNMTYNTYCRPSAAESCPLEAPVPSSLIADVTSEDFCIAVEVDIGLGGTLTSYDDTPAAPYTVPRDNFFLDDTAVFKADLVSDGGIELASTTILDVYLQWGNQAPDGTFENAAYLYQAASGITGDGNATNFAILDQDSNFAGFSFAPVNSVTPVAVDEDEPFSVFCTLEVTYVGSPVKRVETVRLGHPTQGKLVSQTLVRSEPSEAGGKGSVDAAAQVVILTRQTSQDGSTMPEDSAAATLSTFWI